jgi:protein-disulfide isomerase
VTCAAPWHIASATLVKQPVRIGKEDARVKKQIIRLWSVNVFMLGVELLIACGPTPELSATMTSTAASPTPANTPVPPTATATATATPTETPVPPTTTPTPTNTLIPQTATAQEQAAVSQTQAAANADLMKYLIDNTRHFKGDPNAPVTIIEFADFQCPFCGVYATNAGRSIDGFYVDSGEVRIGYWNMAFLGDESIWAAEAAECSADQNQYWEYHDLLFSGQDGENIGAFAKENLKKFAAQLGLDTASFNECLISGKYTGLVKSDTELARQMGVQSTPSFLVNGTPIVGAMSFEDFQKLIEFHLAQ